MNIKTVLRYFYTIRYLKFTQILWRVYRKLKFINTSKEFTDNLRIKKNKWQSVRLSNVKILNNNTFSFLNKQKSYPDKIEWNEEEDLLWLFNLHYFDALCSPVEEEKKLLLESLLNDWIQNNPCNIGVGWDAYPISLRTVNWIKWFLNGQTPKTVWLASLKTQAHVLSQKIEYHLYGNHLLANAKALIFAGLYFDGPSSKKWLNQGLAIFTNQIEEQILCDGGHFELSPMYHNIILHDILDLINLFKTFEHEDTKNLEEILITKARLMINWTKIMEHPDQGISFFNDSAFGIASTSNDLISYAKKLFKLNYDNNLRSEITRLDTSGYIRVQKSCYVALLDCAEIGPSYIPGHGHADTLSFELSIDNYRLLVNSGISCYGISDQRLLQRGTHFHNTVAVNNLNSSEVWSGFRVARRASILETLTEQNEEYLSITSSHDGYKRLKSPVVHNRNWHFAKNYIQIKDNLAVSYTHLTLPTILLV